MRFKCAWGLLVLVLMLLIHAVCQADAQKTSTRSEDSRPFKDILIPKQEPKRASLAPVSSPLLENIAPLYTEPKVQNEGVWLTNEAPKADKTVPLVYRTVYRPSERFPTSIVHMMVLDMKHLTMRMFLGTSEHGGSKTTAIVDKADQSRLVAITSALWQTRHAGRAGLIQRGKVIKKLAPGVATIVVFKDGRVDILEWSKDTATENIWDARQLKHLIVKDGKVVKEVKRRGKVVSAEIGLGSLLNEDLPVLKSDKKTKKGKPVYRLNLTNGPLWFLATRSAFGIRPDGNLVFAIGRHIRTMDLAKALVLAGCVRGMHGDANPGNAVGIVYQTDDTGKIVKRTRLSPYQHKSTLNRYLKRSYPKDFFVFFRKVDGATLVADKSVGKTKEKKSQ